MLSLSQGLRPLPRPPAASPAAAASAGRNADRTEPKPAADATPARKRQLPAAAGRRARGGWCRLRPTRPPGALGLGLGAGLAVAAGREIGPWRDWGLGAGRGHGGGGSRRTAQGMTTRPQRGVRAGRGPGGAAPESIARSPAPWPRFPTAPRATDAAGRTRCADPLRFWAKVCAAGRRGGAAKVGRPAGARATKRTALGTWRRRRRACSTRGETSQSGRSFACVRRRKVMFPPCGWRRGRDARHQNGSR